MDEWEQFESGSYDGGYEDLSMGGESDRDNNLDWQDTLGTEGDLADQWLSQQGETEFNDPESHLVGMDTEQAILNARLRSTGLPITSENQIGVIPEHMRPSDVTVYNLSNLDPSQRNIENLTQKNVMQGSISTFSTPDITASQQRQFDKILNATLRGGESDIDALPAIRGHASDLTKEDYSIGGKSVDQVLYSLAGQYIKQGVSPSTQKNLARQLAIQIPRTSRGMQASFGGEGMVSHLDALPTPMQLPSRFQGMLKPTLSMSGGIYNPDYKESREYKFASPSEQAAMDWSNKPSGMASLTGMPYQGMHKTPEQLANLDPIQATALEAQKDIEADFKGFLSLAGLAKDIRGRKLSSDNSQGTATNFIRPVVGADYFGTSNLDELARHGLMEEAGFTGEGGLEGQMSSLGNYADMITGGVNPVDFNRPFTSEDVAMALGEDVESRVASDRAAAKVFNTKNTRNTFEDIVNTRQSVEDIKAEIKPIEGSKRKSERDLAQANVEAALKARGLSISSAEQGSAEWLEARTNTLTSTGIGTSMDESPYGDTWLGHIKSSINERANPSIAAQRSNPMFDAGTRGEELGKQWFEQKFNKTIVDLGLITDPSKPNQGTSVDGVVASATGEIGDDLELSEFKWGTTSFPPRDAAKKHQQQLQHQMYMTGASSVNLVTGYDPNAGTPRAGNEDDYLFSNEPVFKDPEWAKNNADFIQARANEKAQAVGSGSVESVREGYLAALRERYPNESDKGLTKEERAEKKRIESEAKTEEKEFRKQQAEDSKQIASGMTFLSKGAGGGINLQSSVDYLGGAGMAGKVMSGVIGAGVAAYDLTRTASDYVGRAADMGADSTGAMKASEVALKSLGFNDKQAMGFTERTETQQGMASMGEFDPLVKRLTAYRGLVSMDQLTSMSSAQLTSHLRSQVDEGVISEQQLAGMATVAGDTGIARNFISPEARANILDRLVESAIEAPAGLKANIQAWTDPSEQLQDARDRWTKATNAKTLNSLNPFASDEENARVAKEYQESMAAVELANKVERENNYNTTKVDSNINVVVENKQTEVTLDQDINGKPEPTQRSVAREE